MLTTEVDYEDGGGILFEDIGFKGPVVERLSHKAYLVAVLFRYQNKLSLAK